MIWFSVFLSALYLQQYFISAYTIDPCVSMQCKKDEMACLEIIPGSSIKKAASYECRCAKECKSLNLNYIKSPIVRTVSPLKQKEENGTLVLESGGVPIAKQGGANCYPSSCMNGGTCFSTYNPTTTTTTTTSSYKPTICVSFV